MIYEYKYRDCTEVDINIEGQGRPIVFVHGWGVNCDLYIHQYKELSRDHTVITYDLRGHNPTKRSFTQPSIETLAEDLVEIFTALDLKDAICVGWSMGAFVTWRALDNADFCKRLKGIASIDMSPLAPNHGDWNLGMKGALDKASMIERAKLIRENWSATVNQFVPKIFAAGSTERWSDHMDDIIKDASTSTPPCYPTFGNPSSNKTFENNSPPPMCPCSSPTAKKVISTPRPLQNILFTQPKTPP